ncbi:hypothetical protein [Glycomyces artemisiae]|uniref:Htaa protein n=1 Tax=Glycomyces artemisiae TaxID=1076443 RepID=A0A2T0UX69_9ACTN|nr:hypothetical protein [Glycomyces artemisiae]PRY62523.1 hypothetical protein B0I28_101857 [Glycomyces artemisiae]
MIADFFQRHRIAVAAAAVPLVVLTATAVTAAPPEWLTAHTVQEQSDASPNFRRVAIDGPGATIDLLGQPEPLDTGAFAGEVDLARQPGEEAMTTANLVLASSGEPGLAFGQVAVSLRAESLTDYQYNPDEQSLVVEHGLEFEVERAPGIGVRGEPVFLYTGPLRLLPTEAVDPPVFPPEGQTFALPAPVLLWEGADGVTSSEPIGMLTGFALTVTHPA